MPDKKETHNIRESFNFAIEGVVEAIKTEKHMRFHVWATFMVIILSFMYGVTKYELIILTITISLVWITELINTAVENSIDIVCKSYHPLAKNAKDMAAGAVLVAAVNSLIVGYVIFDEKLDIIFRQTFEFLRSSHKHVFSIILTVVAVAVIWMKSCYKKGTPLKGGMVSGHSALAASIWVNVVFITENIKVFFLSFFLVLMVMQSRIEGKIHTPLETLYGALLGGGLTYFLLVTLKM
ncbi:diacylglycerol kinase [Ilyobacter polytropus]|uniref:Diacylglycerol kinase n=1 Tax=Ilyobacter polytropus (strain ATCC 51220 / DSM 2926 / LMG 16218 / CuHBu1) TaxID=572544 RepID=E3H9Z9_ILYPC|nr:diacylglycerol kinase [Ilyobacter polytropus]ADO83127.1 diacylglycerol kinase [Ilyobacter polytropus DSM 2926]